MQPYLRYLEQDVQLHELIAPILPGLRSLTTEQVETLTFYLKSLHTYYPSSENHFTNFNRFGERLREIREGEEQTRLQRKAAKHLFGAMVTCVIAGVLLALGAVAMFTSAAWGSILLALAVGLFMFAEVRFGRTALEVAKRQDRCYFLHCIRAAQACNELDWAGLFSENGVTHAGPQSETAIEQSRLRIAELSSQLRSALYNDEHMQYSPPRYSSATSFM